LSLCYTKTSQIINLAYKSYVFWLIKMDNYKKQDQLWKIFLCLIAALILSGSAIDSHAHKRGSKDWVVKTKDGNKYIGDISKREQN